jgi:hypothetical protein
MIGIDTARAICRHASIFSMSDKSPVSSGTPRRAFAIAAPLVEAVAKPITSATRAL